MIFSIIQSLDYRYSIIRNIIPILIIYINQSVYISTHLSDDVGRFYESSDRDTQNIKNHPQRSIDSQG